jgi:hypothetical protein
MAQDDQTLSKIVFVGEHRSSRAIQMQVTWHAQFVTVERRTAPPPAVPEGRVPLRCG